MTASAFYRGYVDNGRRAGQVRRLHILRETGTPGMYPRKLGWCGTVAYDVTNSSTRLISPLPARPPESLEWCPACVGRYADYIGLLGEIAGEVAGSVAAALRLGPLRHLVYVANEPPREPAQEHGAVGVRVGPLGRLVQPRPQVVVHADTPKRGSLLGHGAASGVGPVVVHADPPMQIDCRHSIPYDRAYVGDDSSDDAR